MAKRRPRGPFKQLAPGEFIGTADRRFETKSGVVSYIRDQERVERHEHSDTHFVLVMEGAYLTSARDASGVVSDGHVLLNTPGTRHEDRFIGDGKLITFSVADRTLEHFDGSEWVASPARRIHGTGAANALKAIAHEASNFDEVSDLEIEGIAYELLAFAAGRFQSAMQRPRWLERARTRIMDSSRSVPSIKELACDVGVHPVHLTRSFGKFFGQTPGAMTRRVRMQRAAPFLARTRIPICEIALECGFSDQAAFTKAFTRSTGVSPLAFRRRWRN
jgi:AraC family transcriptional regulator